MEKTVVTRLRLEIGNYLSNLGKAGLGTKEFVRQVSGAGTASEKSIKSVGTGALLMGAAVAAGVGMAVKAAINWESAWAGVNKTVSAEMNESAEQTAEAMSVLEGGLRGLARELPASHKAIAGVAEAAGQLGIERDNIVGFTRVMVDLGETTNLAADEAATAIAQMTNIMGTSEGDVDRLGSALVELGNNGASTEAEIMHMALRLAGSGKLIGASESDVLGLSNAMASLGIQSELGGGAMSRTLQKIYTAVKDSGEALDGFARVSGMSADEFAAKWEADPMRALDDFIQGLSDIEAGGGNVIAALREVGIKGTQDLQVLLRLKGAGDLLTESLELGSQAWLENTALQEEAAKRYETTASKLGVLRNQVVDVGIDIGGVFLPAIKTATEGLGTMVTGVSELDGTARTVVTGLATAAGGITGLIGIIGLVGPKVRDFRAGLMDMGTAGQFIGKNLGTIAGVVGAAGFALGLYTYVVGRNAQRQAEAAAAAQEYTDAIKEQGAEAGTATEEIALLAIVHGDLGTALADAEANLEVFGDALSAGDIEGMRDDLTELIVTLGTSGVGLDMFIDQIGDTTVAGTALGDELLRLAETGDMSRGKMSDLIVRILEQSEAYEQGKVGARNQADAVEAAGDAAGDAVGATAAHTQALQSQTAAAEEAVDALKELIDAERAAVDPLFAMLDATWGNRDAQVALAEAYKANADGIDDNNVSLAELDALHQAATKSALDMEGAAMGLAGAIEIGTVNVDIAKGMLADWVTQGLITQETAIRMGVLFDEAAVKAGLLAGDKVVNLVAVDNASSVLDALGAKLAGIQRAVYIDVTTGVRQGPLPPEARGVEGGGPITATGMRRPGPTDTVPVMAAEGEFMFQKSAVDRIGLDNLTRMNATGQVGAVAIGGAGATDAGARFTGGQPSEATGGTSITNNYFTNIAVTVAPGAGADGRRIGQDLLTTLRKEVRIGGGNVQQVLGQGG